ncbi:MAG: hypothetical protein IH917_12160, partial [Acidobacteria bacterium]|nr:hypothetical protein [Acidobacteriota bacterium]
MEKRTGLWSLGPTLTPLLFLAATASMSFLGFAEEKISPAPAFSAEELLALPTDGWITNGGNVFNQRYSPLTQITPENVENLKAVWRVHLGSGLERKDSGEAPPIVHKG